MKFRGAITKEEYIRLEMGFYYSKPGSIITPLVIFTCFSVALYYFRNDAIFNQILLLMVMSGFMSFLFIPATVYAKANRVWKNNRMFHETLDYEVGPEGFYVEGLSFSSTFTFDKFLRLVESKHFFLFYSDKFRVILLPKGGLGADELTQLRDIFRKVSVIKTKKLFQ